MEKHSKIKSVMACKVSNDDPIEYVEKPYFATRWKTSYWFNVLNRELFGNKLTTPRGIFIKENLTFKDIKAFAECQGFYDRYENPVCDIYLNDKFRHIQHFISVLAHEMIHMHQWEFDGSMNHSRNNFFKPWKEKFAKFGIKLLLKY